MGLISSLLVKLGLESAQFETGIKRSINSLKSLEQAIIANQRMLASLTPMQAQITGLFKTAGPEFTLQLRKQMESQAHLEDALYRVTHTQREIMLREAEHYFAAMKEEWTGNEKMMTLITQTETATRLRIAQDYSTNFMALQRRMAWLVRAGVYAYLAKGAMEFTAELIKGQKAGKDWADAISHGIDAAAKKIPILNQLISGIEAIGDAIWSLSEKTKRLEEMRLGLEKFTNLTTQMTRTIKLLSVPPERRPELQLFFEYEDTIEELKTIRDLTGNIATYEWGLAKATEQYNIQLKELRTRPIQDIIEKLEKQADTFGMTATEITLYDAAIKGATNEQMNLLEVFAEEIYWLEKDKKYWEDLAKEMEEYDKVVEKIMSEVARLFEETRTPVERYMTTIEKLNQWLEKGFIDWDLYSRGIERANEEFLKFTESKQRIGEFKEIRPMYVAVAGLALGKDREVNELQKLSLIMLKVENNTRRIADNAEGLG